MLLEKYRMALPIPRTIGTLTRHAADRRNYRHTYSPHQCWSSVVSGGPTLFRHWVNVSCLLESGHSAFSRQRADQASPCFTLRALSVYRPSQYTSLLTQQTRYIVPLLVQCWASILDGGPRLNQHWDNVSCLLGRLTQRWL